MRLLFSSSLILGLIAVSACRSRQYGDSDTNDWKNSTSQSGGPTTEKPTADSSNLPSEEVNPAAFNAFERWRLGLRKGQGVEALGYPADWKITNQKRTADEVFYASESAYYKWENGESNFESILKWPFRNLPPFNEPVSEAENASAMRGIPTEGAKLVGDVLEYPSRNGLRLTLKFSAPYTKTGLSQFEAADYCAKQHLRLPTIRELFDFCKAGVSDARKQTNSVCAGRDFMSASTDIGSGNNVWCFNGKTTGIKYVFTHYVRTPEVAAKATWVGDVTCVGPAH
jgi:hypothetical protein